jgi:hypothetical protein
VLDVFASSLADVYSGGNLDMGIPAFPSSLESALMAVPIVSVRATLFNYTSLQTFSFQAAMLSPVSIIGVTVSACAVQFSVARQGSSYHMSALIAGSGTVAGSRFTISLPFNSPVSAPTVIRFPPLAIDGTSIRDLVMSPGLAVNNIFNTLMFR